MSLARQLCPYLHSQKRYDPAIGALQWRRGDNEALGILILSNGQPQYKMQCRNCGWRSSALPIKLVTNGWRLTQADVEWIKVHDSRPHEPCSYVGCDEVQTEYHHFAPRNTFGSDADNWPCLPLCRTHHVDWHQRMDGYAWHRKGVEPTCEQLAS